MAPRPPFPLFSQIAKKVFFNDEGLLKDMLSLTLTLGWKNEKRPSGPTELDLEAGNLVLKLIFTQTSGLALFKCEMSQLSDVQLETHDVLCSYQ